RAAEELVFGPDKITTGAGNDIDRATAMARRMVTQFGMSDVIGPMAVGDSEQEVFLGRELVQRREVSERTAQLVDQEVKKFLDEAYARAKRILEENRDLLEAIAEALLERETLDREDIELLAAGEPLPPVAAGEGPASRAGRRKASRFPRSVMVAKWRRRAGPRRCRRPRRGRRPPAGSGPRR